MFDAYLSELSGFPGIVLAAIGAFYVFAGLVLARQMMLDRVLSRAIEMISLEKQSRVEALQQVWMIVSAILIFAAGATLLFMSRLAVWLFAAALVQQVLYLTWVAPRYFDLEDEPDPAGRRQSTNATILFGAMTLAVVAAATNGNLLPLSGAGLPSLLVSGAVTLAFAVWMLIRLRMPIRPGAHDLPEIDDADEEPVALAEIDGLRLCAEWYELPVMAFFADGVSDFLTPGQIGLSDALGQDLDAWQSDYNAICEYAESDMVPVWTEEQKTAHFDQAAALAGRIRGEMRAAGHERIAVSWQAADGTMVFAE